MSASSIDADALAAPRRGSMRGPVVYWWVILLLLNYQFTPQFTLGEPNAAEEIRLYHVFLPLFAIFTLGDLGSFSFRKEMNPALLFLVVDLACNLYAYSRYGFVMSGIARIFFAGMCYYLGRSVALRLSYDELGAHWRKFLGIYFVTVAGQMLFRIAERGSFNLYAADQVFIAGGINAEAAWVGIQAMIFVGNGAFWAILFSIVASGIYGSRSGLMIGVFAAVSALYPIHRRKGFFRAWLMMALYFAAAAVAAIVLAGAGVTIIERISNIGAANDSSISRLALWAAIPILFTQEPLGYGIGNIMSRVYDLWSGVDLPRINNPSNIYAALILEGGIIAFVSYLWMMGSITWQHFRTHRYRNLFLMIVAYWFTGLTGFYGYDPHFWVIMGLYFTYLRRGEPGAATPPPLLPRPAAP